jgi:Tfp pilus assembly protein PilF
MSVIHDALKMAQREKQRRESGGRSGVSPLIVPLRGGRADPSFSWKNTLTIAIASVVIVGASWSLYVRMKNLNPVAARSVPVPTLQAEAPAPAAGSNSAAPDRALPPPEESVARRDSAAPPALVASQPVRRASGPPVARQPVISRAVAAAPAAQTDSAVAAPLREPVQSGRLRIAVEQPREGDAARLFAMGVAAHRSGDLGAARSAYERVLVLAPNDVDALNNMGVLLAASRELDRAESLLRRAVRVAPRHAGAWNNLGTVLAQRGQAADAIAAFQQALALDPQHQGARVSMAQQHIAIGAPDKARQLLEEVLAGNPAMPEAHYAMGQAYELERDWAGAVRAYQAFVRVAPARMAEDVARVQQRVQMLSARVK